MQLTITLTEDELNFLKKVIEDHKSFETKQCTLEDAVHECIRTSIHIESEEAAS